MRRFISHLFDVLNFLRGLVSVLLRRKRHLTPVFIRDLKLRVPFLTFLYSATWLAKYFNGDDRLEGAVRAAVDAVFGIRNEGDKQ